METPYCDVIGCGAHAQWFLVSERDRQTEEQFVCQQHWRQLMADRSRRVIRWSRATQDRISTPDPLPPGSPPESDPPGPIVSTARS